MSKWTNNLLWVLLYFAFFFFSLVSGIGVYFTIGLHFSELSVRRYSIVIIVAILLRTAIMLFVARKVSGEALLLYATSSLVFIFTCFIFIAQSPLAIVELIGFVALLVTAIIVRSRAKRDEMTEDCAQ